MTKKPLGQKPEIINTHPLLEQRLAAARNGYTQNPCTLKRKPCKNWPRLSCSVEAIRAHREWRDEYFAGTALRIHDDLLAVDADVSTSEVADEIRDLIRSLAPDLFDLAIMRTSGGISFAMFWRWLTPIGHLKTLHYTAHPDVLAELIAAREMPDSVERDKLLTELADRLEPQHFEVFGSAAKGRYFQYVGPHSRKPKDPEDRDYQCGKRAPWNTPRSDLPVLPVSPGELVHRVEDILARHLTLIPAAPMPVGEVFYDLDPEMEFVLKDGSHEKLGDLMDMLEWGAEHGIYGCMSDAAWAQSKSKENAKAYVTTKGRMAIKDWSNDGVMHYMKSEAPPPPVEIDDYTITILKGLMQQTEPGVEAAPDVIDRSGTDQEVHDSAFGWCTRNLAWYPQAFNGRGGIVSIHPDGAYQKPITLPALRSTMASCVYVSTGPNGGLRKHNPADAWMAQAARVDIAGIRMRPELSRPLFREDGALYVNRYMPPAHPTSGGSTVEFDLFLQRLVPDLDEREWSWNWFSAKMQHPEWRMIALVMVAEAMGTGRGLLSEILGKVFGDQFVAPIPYSKLSGGGGSNFNSEVENRLIVCVNESHNAEDKKYRNRNAAGEALKVFVEPNHELPFRVEPKGVDAYYTRSAVSTLVFTNHIDGLPIGEGDRRAAVVANGEPMSFDERQRLRAWKDRPENIGALARLLAKRAVPLDPAIFDPYSAPAFQGRALMIEASKSAIDMAWDEARRAIFAAADLVTMSQAVKILKHHLDVGTHAEEEVLKRHVALNAKRIGVPNGTRWLVSYDKRRERVYAGSARDAKRYTEGGESAVLRQLDLAQKLADAPDRILNKHLGLVPDDDVGG